MKKLTIAIEPGETPASLESINALRASLDKLRVTVSGLSTACLGLVVVGFFGGKAMATLGLSFDKQVADILFLIGMVGFFLSYKYERGPLARCIASVQPVPDELLAETAMLAQRSPKTKAYLKAVRAQGREFILAEYVAFKKLVAEEPSDNARKVLYG